MKSRGCKKFEFFNNFPNTVNTLLSNILKDYDVLVSQKKLVKKMTSATCNQLQILSRLKQQQKLLPR